MKAAIALVTAAMAADFLTFALVVPIVGIGAELNPVIRDGYARIGLLFVGALKFAALIVILLLVSRTDPGPKRWLAVALGAFIGLVGAFGNTTAWLSTSP